MNFSITSDQASLLKRLQPPREKVRMVIDTDTYNEIDDQFAVVYALLSPEQLDVKAIYAAPFYNARSTSPADGMEKSYQEILRLLVKMGRSPDNFVFRGSPDYMPDTMRPHRSEAAMHLIELAMEQDNLLYVAAIGAITNVVSAILLEPRILDRIVVVWLGGNPPHWPHTREFNLRQDLRASKFIFDCGVPLVHIPCKGVASHLLTTVPEIECYVEGRGAIGDYLAEIFKAYYSEHYAWSKVIWDIATIAYLINDSWIPTEIIHSPIVTDRGTWSVDHSRHFIRSALFAHRDPIFRDLFKKLETTWR